MSKKKPGKPKNEFPYVTDEAAAALGMTLDEMTQYARNAKEHSAPDPQLPEHEYIDRIIPAAMSRYTPQHTVGGREAVVFFLAMLSAHYETRPIVKRADTLPELRHALDVNTRSALEQALRTICSIG